VTILTKNQLQDLELQTRVQISQQETVLATIAETTARNGADSVTEQIIRDCSLAERSAFDTLLDDLNDGLAQAQLIELERLFGRCGTFFSERKSMMVARLARETEVYDSYVNQLSTILDTDVTSEFSLSQWNTLVQQELKQAQLFASLVQKQDEIIAALLAGRSADSQEITAILREVKEIQDTLVVANKQAANTRALLISF
jgi:hypothetical protein